jgi:putative transposase
MGTTEGTFYNWKGKYGNLGIRTDGLKQLEDENSRVKKPVADLSLDKQMLQDVIKKSLKASPEE